MQEKKVIQLSDLLSLSPLSLSTLPTHIHTQKHTLPHPTPGPNSRQGLVYGNFQAAAESEAIGGLWLCNNKTYAAQHGARKKNARQEDKGKKSTR